MTDEARRDGGEQDSPADAVPAVDVAGAALGALPVAEVSEVRGVVASDDRAAAELVAMEEVVAELAWLVPRRQMNRGRSAGVRSRLVSRAAASRDGRKGAPSPPSESTKPVAKAVGAPSPPLKPTGLFIDPGMTELPARKLPPVRQRSFNWLALAAGIALVATAGALVRVMRNTDDFRHSVATQQASMLRRMADLKSSMSVKDSLIASLTGPQMKVVDMTTYDSRNPLARMYWDQKTQEWTMYAYHLRQPASGKTFQVWLITRISNKPISAGVFTPDARGVVVMHAKYTLEPGMLRKVAITEEPTGGVPYPTGPLIVAGAGK